MAVEMGDAFPVHLQGIRLAYVMEQYRQPQYPSRIHETQGTEGVFPHAVAVMGMILGRLHHPVKFRKDYLCDTTVIGQPQYLRMGRTQQLHQFCLDPLFADLLQGRGQSADGFCRVLLDPIAKLGREPDGPQDTQGILTEPLPRISHTADPASLDICQAPKAVHQALMSVVGHGVDGQVPPLQVLP